MAHPCCLMIWRLCSCVHCGLSHWGSCALSPQTGLLPARNMVQAMHLVIGADIDAYVMHVAASELTHDPLCLLMGCPGRNKQESQPCSLG